MNDAPRVPSDEKPEAVGLTSSDPAALSTDADTDSAHHVESRIGRVSRPSWFAATAVLLVCLLSFTAGRTSTAPTGDGRVLPMVSAPNGMELAPGAPAGTRNAADARWSPYGYGLLLIAGSQLPDESGTADGWMFRSTAERGDTLAALRKVTGLTSIERDDYGQLTVSEGDGSSLWVSGDQLGSFGAYVASRSPWICEGIITGKPGIDVPMGLAADSGGSAPVRDAVVPGSVEPAMVEPAPQPCHTRGTPQPARARSQALDAFRLLGLDLDNTTVTVRPDEASVNVTAEILLGGTPTGMSWSADVSADGVYSLYGFTAQGQRIVGYPVVGAVTAVTRSADPRFMQFGPVFLGPWDTGGIVPLVKDSNVGPGTPPQSGAVTTLPESVTSGAEATTTSGGSGSAVAQPTPVRTVDGRPVLTGTLDEVVITSATMALSQFNLGDGSVALLPVWVLRADDGRTWSMLALDDRYVEFSPMRG